MLTFAPKTMAALLPLLADIEHGQTLGHTASISLARVQAWPWNEGRLTRCAARLAAGERAPAIHVQRYWLLGEAYYTVDDGRHRAVAAKQADRRRIRAVIHGENWCQPGAHWLDLPRGILWRETEQPGRLRWIMNEIDGDLRAALLAVGVNELR